MTAPKTRNELIAEGLRLLKEKNGRLIQPPLVLTYSQYEAFKSVLDGSVEGRDYVIDEPLSEGE